MAKPKKKLQLHNERALYVIDFLVDNHLVKDHSAALKKIGFEHVNNIGQVRSGVRGFRQEHLSMLCEKFGADGNFFMLRHYNTMFRKDKVRGEMILLKEAVAVVAMKMTALSSSK